MSEARECAGCGGGGDDCAVMRSHHEDRPCRFCKGTGKVWPSVEGESVIKGMPFILDDPVLTQDRFDDAVAQVTEAIEKNWRTGCLIIVQPLPSPDGRDGKESK